MLIDTHAHLNGPEFAEDVWAVLERAVGAGVGRVICVGYDLATSERAIALAERDPRLAATVGVHPNSVTAAPARWQDRLARLAAHPRVVAVGETGLDYHRDWTPPAVQREALRWHLDLADDLGLPVIIHNRDADADLGPTLRAWADRRRSPVAPGVLHSFASGLEMMAAGVEAGFAISFSGMATFPNKSLAHLADVVRAAPAAAVLVETDAPYLAPVPVRGRRSEPAFVRHVAARVAALRGVTEAELEIQTTTNALRVFPRLGDGPHA